MGKGAVRFMVNLDEMKRQIRLQTVNDRPRPTVAGVDDDGEWLHSVRIDIAQQMPQIITLVRPLGQRSAPIEHGELVVGHRQIANIKQPLSPLIGLAYSRTSFMPL
jgi:hypothetical protein